MMSPIPDGFEMPAEPPKPNFKVPMDKQGRLRVPKALRDYMGWEPDDTFFQGEVDTETGLVVFAPIQLPDMKPLDLFKKKSTQIKLKD